MKVSYDRDEDILLIEVDDKTPIDHAEHNGSLIVHLDLNDRPVLIEILQATAFLTSSLAASMRAEPVTVGSVGPGA